MKTCRTCCRPVASPYRIYNDAGKVIQGCIDSDHDGHLIPLSESSFWHNRQEAKKLRSQSAKQFPRIKQ